MVSSNYEEEISDKKEFDVEERCFELPDGTILSFTNKAKLNSGEVLLKPSLLIQDKPDQIVNLFNSISKCESNL